MIEVTSFRMAYSPVQVQILVNLNRPYKLYMLLLSLMIILRRILSVNISRLVFIHLYFHVII